MADPVIGGWGVRLRTEASVGAARGGPDGHGFAALVDEAKAAGMPPSDLAGSGDGNAVADAEDGPAEPDAASEGTRTPDAGESPPLAAMVLPQNPCRAVEATWETGLPGAAQAGTPAEGDGAGPAAMSSGAAGMAGLDPDGPSGLLGSTGEAADLGDAAPMDPAAPPPKTGSATATATAAPVAGSTVAGSDRGAAMTQPGPAATPTGIAKADAEFRSLAGAGPNAAAGDAEVRPEALASALPRLEPMQKASTGPALRTGPMAAAGPDRARSSLERLRASGAEVVMAERSFVAAAKARLGSAQVGMTVGGRPWPLRDDAIAGTGEGRGGFQSTLAQPLGEGASAAVIPPAMSEGSRTTRRIARQIAVQPVLRSGGAAELSLAPKELGQLHLRVEIEDGGLRVLIEAARPDIADLMRRHVETLRQELRSEGLGSVSVSIEGGRQEQGETGSRRDPRPGPAGIWPALPELESDASSKPPRSRNLAGHIDLRF